MFAYTSNRSLFDDCACVLRNHNRQTIIFDVEGYNMTVYTILSIIAVACIIAGLCAECAYYKVIEVTFYER